VRHRTSRTKHGASRTTFLGLVFKLAAEAAKSWRRIRALQKPAERLSGTPYQDGIPVTDIDPSSKRPTTTSCPSP
jgi:hypothetical protein